MLVTSDVLFDEPMFEPGAFVIHQMLNCRCFIDTLGRNQFHFMLFRWTCSFFSSV